MDYHIDYTLSEDGSEVYFDIDIIPVKGVQYINTEFVITPNSCEFGEDK